MLTCGVFAVANLPVLFAHINWHHSSPPSSNNLRCIRLQLPMQTSPLLLAMTYQYHCHAMCRPLRRVGSTMCHISSVLCLLFFFLQLCDLPSRPFFYILSLLGLPLRFVPVLALISSECSATAWTAPEPLLSVKPKLCFSRWVQRFQSYSST